MQSFMKLVHEIAEESEENVPDSEMRLTLAKSGYLVGGNIPTLRDVYLKKRCI